MTPGAGASGPGHRRRARGGTRPGAAGVVADVGVGLVLVGYHAAVHGRGARHHRLGLNLAAAAVAVGAGTAAGLTVPEMGISPGAVRRGALVGAAVAGPLVGAVAAAYGSDRSRRLLHDRRVETLAPRDLAFEAGVRIPVETALAEEVLFRGVYEAWLRRHGSVTYSTAVGALVFGLWHVPPARASLDRTSAGARVGDRRAHRAGAVAVTVGTTALAGVGFSLLRRSSGSVVAPIVVHATLNAAGLIGAWTVARRTS